MAQERLLLWDNAGPEDLADTHTPFVNLKELKSLTKHPLKIWVALTGSADFFYACNFLQQFFFGKNALVEKGRGNETEVRLPGKFGKGPGVGEKR